MTGRAAWGLLCVLGSVVASPVCAAPSTPAAPPPAAASTAPAPAAASPERVPAEVRVRSTPGPMPSTSIDLRATPSARVEDRTPGAKPGAAGQGAASSGETFTDEITLWIAGFVAARSASVEVGDDLVSAVRLFPEAAGTTVVVFVRQPVSYTVAPPTGLGQIALVLRARTLPQPAAAGQPGGRRPQRFGAAESVTGEVSVDAESLAYEKETDTLIARGAVTLKRGALTLRADEVRYDRKNGVADAKGHVVVVDPQATMQGDAAHLNMDDETGWMQDANADLEASGYALKAGKIDKQGGPLYHVDRGVFTTCRCGGLERPSWSIASKSADIEMGGLGVAHDGTFRILDVPVLWFPVLPFPANTDRQSGFLFPRIGYSNRRGVQYEQPFYWAIDKSQDLTIAPDVETAARVGLLAEYRYVLSKQAKGQFAFAYYNEAIRTKSPGLLQTTVVPTTTPENRFALFGHHDQPAYGGSDFYLDLFAVSDPAFLQEINTLSSTISGDLLLRTARYARSRTGLLKEWDGGMVQAEASWAQDLVDPPEFAPQRMPQLQVEHTAPLLDDHLVARVDASTTDFYRQTGFDGFREDVAPGLVVPLRWGRWINGQIGGQVRETAYQLRETQQTGIFVPDNPGLAARPVTVDQRVAAPLSEVQTRELAIANARLGTEIARVYDFKHLGLEKLRHSIEPELRWIYVPVTGQNYTQVHTTLPSVPGRTRVPGTFLSRGYLFDEVDAINHRNFFSYGLTTRLLGRPTGAPAPPQGADADEEEEREAAADEAADGDGAAALPVGSGLPAAPLQPTRELLRFSILHGVDASRPIVATSHFSDVDLGMRFTPLDWAGVTYNATWDFRAVQVQGQSFGVVLREPWWQPQPGHPYQSATTLGITYSYVRPNVNTLVGVPNNGGVNNAGSDTLAASLYLRLGEYVGFTFLARYDFNGGIAYNQDGQLVNVGPGFLERDYFLRLISKCNCWAIEAGLSDRSNPDERLYRVQVSLLGLGSIGRGPQTPFMGLGAIQGLGFRRPTALGGSGLSGY